MTTETQPCPIWGDEYEATVQPSGYPFVTFVDSDRAGGKYLITSEAQDCMYRLKDYEKARLTTWLVGQRLHSNTKPLITEQIAQSAKDMQPLRVHERAERLLKFICGKAEIIGAKFGFSVDSAGYHAVCAWSESSSLSEIDSLLSYLEGKKWIIRCRGNQDCCMVVTVDGYSRIEEQATNLDSSQAFVAMWFHESMNTVYEDGIKPAIEGARYTPLRIDQEEHINKIDDQIIAEIRRSRFLVADFTQGNDGARGGVYFEAGFAHGLGIPVIYTCRKDIVDNDELHFDTRQYNHIVWTNPDKLRGQLKNRILAVIGEGPNASTHL